ncbi:hypothetical protein AQ490_16310 [Wenjunlia vitaminophila]|uniref:HTH lysR-type domain-containing protein n=1 Tax=Wenjunlia vitaminophila TaxID=76728 RepID=A0A0T6LXZ6_WENVI|nr:LysR family transcriptional regulator [Wenjunlia vitaminophila]KRV50620.1 hypothetical protein AQ490_16310 [Wenjunlia vitaminophila]
MDLVRHLRYFATVADERHFGQAAARLGLAQPSLSQRIQRLEREFGVRLFDRGGAGGRGVELTEAGRLLLAEARLVLERADALFGVAARVRSGEAGVLHAAVPQDLGSTVVAALVGEFRERSPGVRLALREVAAEVQLAELAAGSLDVGVLRHPCDVAGLELGAVLCRPLGVLLSADAGGEGPVHLADLSGRELVLFPRQSGPALHDDIVNACRLHGFEPGGVISGQDPAFVDGMVLSGQAVTFAARGRDLPAGMVWRPLVGTPLWERVSAAWLRGRRADPAVRLFAEVVGKVLERQGGMVPVAESVRERRTVQIRPATGFVR